VLLIRLRSNANLSQKLSEIEVDSSGHNLVKFDVVFVERAPRQVNLSVGCLDTPENPGVNSIEVPLDSRQICGGRQISNGMDIARKSGNNWVDESGLVP
jgi:hypothetical protein